MNKRKIKLTKVLEKYNLYKPLNWTLLIQIVGMLVYFAGAAFNHLAVVNNECRMPVLMNDYKFRDSTHFSFTDATSVKYFFLTDIFRIKINDVRQYIISLGDIFVVVGTLIILVGATFTFKIIFKARKLRRK